jgi:hypothetical protein
MMSTTADQNKKIDQRNIFIDLLHGFSFFSRCVRDAVAIGGEEWPRV